MFHFHKALCFWTGFFICFFLTPNVYAAPSHEDLDWSIRKVAVVFECTPQDMMALQQAYTTQKQCHPLCADLALLSLNLNAPTLHRLNGIALAALFQELYNIALWVESQPNCSEETRNRIYNHHAAIRMNDAMENQLNISLNRLHL